MGTYVLVHAAWHGGWEWCRVAERLRAKGHRVFTPTLTGLGERSHLLSRDVGLETHILDVLNVIRWEDLDDVVLVGHSYSGFVITGVADRLPDNVIARVYFDAFVPSHGQNTFDLTPEWRAREILDLAREAGDGWFVPPHHSERWVSDARDRAWLESKVTPHPLRTLEDRLHLSGGLERVPVRVFVLSEAFSPSPFWQFYETFKLDSKWRVLKLPTLHDAMISMPEEVTAILENI